MRSLSLKILLSSFLTVIFVGVAIVVPAAVVIPSAGRFGWAGSLIPILALAVSGLICFLLTRHITSPLFQLRRGAAAIAVGNLAARVPADVRDRGDEIGQLRSEEHTSELQ